MTTVTWNEALDTESQELYRRALLQLKETGVPFLVGGAYAFARYTGIKRHTKDFDVFIRESDYDTIAAALAEAGYRTELTFPHWLGKAFIENHFIDLIFGGGNGIAVVDDEWFTHATDDTVFGVPVKLVPAEEMLWSKAYIMERERYDGADVAHLIHSCAERMDWWRLIRRFGDHWRVLMAHLTIYGFIYPWERTKVPSFVMKYLLRRLAVETDAQPPGEKTCHGTILSRQQYLVDVDRWGYRDGRLMPHGTMTEEDVAHWTAAIEKE